MQAEGKEPGGRERIKIETEGDGQNKGTGLAGRGGIGSSGERLDVETVTKEEKQGGL